MTVDNPSEQLRILILEDVPSDAELEIGELRDAGLAFTSLRVDTRDAFEQALDEFKPDVILADYRLPGYNGRDALAYVRGTHPQIPVIIVTGAMGDEAAVELLKLGAKDYVLKDRLARLAPAIKRALSEERGIRSRKLAEGKYKAVFNEAMDGIVLIDCGSWQAVECNPEFEKQTGRSLTQLKDMKIWEVLIPEQHEMCRQNLLDIQSGGSGRGSDYKFRKPSGDIVPFEFSAKFLNIQQQRFIQAVSRDISERLRAEQALHDSEARYKRITEGITDYQYTVRVEHGRAVETTQSPGCVTVTGYGAEEFAAKPDLWIQMVVPEDREQVLERVRQVLAGMDVPPSEHRIIRKDGGLRWVSDTNILFRDASGKLLSYDGVIRDITERKQASIALQISETRLQLAIRTGQLGVWELDLIDHTAYRSLQHDRIFGYESLLPKWTLEMFLEHVLPQDRAEVNRGFNEAVAKRTDWNFECRIRRIDGEVRWIWANGSHQRDASGAMRRMIGIVQDITERRQSENALRRANRALQTLSGGNLVLVRSASEFELLRGVTKVIVETGGYRLATVDYANDDADRSIAPVAWSGMEETQYWAEQLTWADNERGQLPVARVIRSGTTQLSRDIANDPGFAPWKEAARARGYVSNIALPLSDGNKTFGCLSIYSSATETFDDEEIRLLEEMANDLAYGIITFRARSEREQHAAILRQSLEQSIETIAATVEARDPYTAGHQRRVGELATAIAREMDLPEEQINGIHLAAIIHDLGKIHIPAEILSKPGKLNDIEFMLIKTHPQAGYDILKDVRFPWPIANIILQHHEKLDGSGYPQGLKGEQILLEARILTVADVVEAMSSHRPYRPTLGSLAALSEIDRGRGSAYDPAVVDACRKLFVDKGFRFSD